jgi:hypothetical protein
MQKPGKHTLWPQLAVQSHAAATLRGPWSPVVLQCRASAPAAHGADVGGCGAVCRVSSLLRQPSDEPVAVRLVAFAAALLPVILASGLAYKYASGSSLSGALYKVWRAQAT